MLAPVCHTGRLLQNGHLPNGISAGQLPQPHLITVCSESMVANSH